MNQETKLKLQAYLDHELSGREAQEIAALVEQDSAARTVCDELREIRTLLRNNEPEIKLPESREFFWSKIEQSISRELAGPPARQFLRGHPWWMRIFAPAAGVAFLLAATLSVIKLAHPGADLTYLHEIETPLADTTSMSFYSASEGMTVVWVQSRIY